MEAPDRPVDAAPRLLCMRAAAPGAIPPGRIVKAVESEPAGPHKALLQEPVADVRSREQEGHSADIAANPFGRFLYRPEWWAGGSRTPQLRGGFTRVGV